MQSRLLPVLVIVMLLLSATPGLASGPTVDGFGHPSRPLAPPAEVASPAGGASLALGQPGLSFRYAQTFGTSGVPYISDTLHLNFPYGVNASGSTLWVGESYGHRALAFDSNGSVLQVIGGAGLHHFQNQGNKPIGFIVDAAADGSGNTWLVDSDLSQVLKFDSQGNFVSLLGTSSQQGSDNSHFALPAGIAFDSAGNIYVSDGVQWWSTDVGNQRIQIFDSAGTYLNTIGTGAAGSSDNQFHGPRHIAIYQNTLYVADAGNHRVQIFDVSNPASPSKIGTLGTSGQAGNDSTHLDNPSGVAVDANYVYVADTDNHRVQIFSRTGLGAAVATLGSGPGTGNDQFNNPSDVAVDAAGNLYVADYVNCRVQQFNSSRQYVRTYGATGVPYVTDGYHYNNPAGIAVDTDGSIFLAEDNGQRLLKLNAAGVPQWTVGTAGVKGDWDNGNTSLDNPMGVALDGAGRVYVADQWHNRVQAFRTSDGAYQATVGDLNCPQGVRYAGGKLYVANTCNHTVEIYDSNLSHQATLGVSGVAGSDDSHFDQPGDVALDSQGNLYVADTGNQRVQVFSSSRVYQRTLGTPAQSGSDFAHFGSPRRLAVDSANRLYVADNWNNRIQVFDASGAYLATVGGIWGAYNGDLRGTQGLAVDRAGKLYVTDYEGCRVQVYTPSASGWRQTNLSGFGDNRNWAVTTLAPFGDQLYAGTRNTGSGGGQLWRQSPAGAWTAVRTDGFGDTTNVGIDHLVEFKGSLYAGTWNRNASGESNGGQIWRSATGNAGDWTRVASAGFDDPTNGEVFGLAVFSDTLVATTWSYTTTHGAQVWISSSGDAGTWSQVAGNGFGDAHNQGVLGTAVYGGHLYAGTYNWNDAASTSAGGQVWWTEDGSHWAQNGTNGLGTTDNYAVSALAGFGGHLYAGTLNWNPATNRTDGRLVYRCQTCDGSDWSAVVTDSFGDATNAGVGALTVYDGALYATTYNVVKGTQVWRSTDGAQWQQVNASGFGDSTNFAPYWGHSIAVFDDSLYVGTSMPNGERGHGGQVWKYLGRTVYLPAAQH